MVHPDAESLRGREDVYQWYTAEIESIPPVTRELFEKYAGVEEGRVVGHVGDVVCFVYLFLIDIIIFLIGGAVFSFAWGFGPFLIYSCFNKKKIPPPNF